LPTLGRPTITTDGNFSVIFSNHRRHKEPKAEGSEALSLS
jgi:hypothetical protein